MRPTEKIKKLFAKSNVTVTPEIDNRIMTDALQAFEKKKQSKPAPLQPNIWRIIMKSKITKLVAAACVIIAAIIGFHRFGAKIDVASTAWANVLQNIYKATTVSFDGTIDYGPLKKMRSMVNKSGVIRIDSEDGVILFDHCNGIDLYLDTKAKKAAICHKVDKAGNRMISKPYNLLNELTRLKDKGKFVGKEKIDGKNTDVFIFEQPFVKTTIWVDVATELPVRYESTEVPNTNNDIKMPHLSINYKDFGGDTDEEKGSSISGGMGIVDRPITVTKSNFQWNVELDDSLFDMTPPPDYTVEEIQQDVSGVEGDKNYLNLIDALAFWTEMSEGMFPDNLNDLGDPNTVKPLLIKKFYKGLSPKEEFDSAYKQLQTIVNALWMIQQEKAYGTWSYAGQGVKLGQADTPVCWWKLEKRKLWRIIYADLTTKDVNETELPKIK